MSDVFSKKKISSCSLKSCRISTIRNEESSEVEEAQSLVNYVGKMGYVQLGFIHQGVAFLHESSTPWYERYQQLLESVDDFSNIVFEQNEDDDE